VGIGLAGIVVTHKVAGPIFKMKKHLGEVSEGKYQVPWSLRKGDELVEFFESFRTMVVALRDEREAHMKVIQSAVDSLGDEKPEVTAALTKLRADMEKSLG
jgi:nitrogen fixation/metabolism regulation signal transduction histidine kinase